MRLSYICRLLTPVLKAVGHYQKPNKQAFQRCRLVPPLVPLPPAVSPRPVRGLGLLPGPLPVARLRGRLRGRRPVLLLAVLTTVRP